MKKTLVFYFFISTLFLSGCDKTTKVPSNKNIATTVKASTTEITTAAAAENTTLATTEPSTQISTENNNSADINSMSKSQVLDYMINEIRTQKDILCFTSNENISYVDQHDSFFPANSEVLAIQTTDKTLKYKHIKKNINAYPGKLMYLEKATVTFIREDEKSTYIDVRLPNENTDYFILYFGKLDDIYEGDTVNVYALPISCFSYPNKFGIPVETLTTCGSYISKIE